MKVPGKGAKVRWKARYTAADGSRPSAGTFARKGPCSTPREDARCCAQHAIDAAYDKEDEAAQRATAKTVAEYFATWQTLMPRGARTNASNKDRITRAMKVTLEGTALGDWLYQDLRRRHGDQLLAALLTDHGRAAEGARGILRSLSAMTNDAIRHDVAEINPFMGLVVRDSDPRVQKAPRKPRVYTFEQMHAFAAAAGPYEGLLRAICDCGLRLGEVIGLDRADYTGDTINCKGTADPKGTFIPGDTPTKQHVRAIAVAPSAAALIVPRIDTLVLFPTPTGKRWQQRNFYRTVWHPTREKVPGMQDARPHDFRHSWVTNLRALGVDPADLADMGGHGIDTATDHYTHALRRSGDAVRAAIG